MIVLASGSPRRRMLLAQAGYTFTQTSADIDESVYPGEAPDAYTLRVSRQKAEAVHHASAPDALIITADTSVVDGDEILGKPADEAEATAMLQQLRGRMHVVMTAFTVLDMQSDQVQQQLVSTEVIMRDYSDAEIAAYVASGDPMDKAGGYAIQNRAFAPVASISGCYANVVGLPLCQLVAVLTAAGYVPATPPDCDFPERCGTQIE